MRVMLFMFGLCNFVSLVVALGLLLLRPLRGWYWAQGAADLLVRAWTLLPKLRLFCYCFLWVYLVNSLIAVYAACSVRLH